MTTYVYAKDITLAERGFDWANLCTMISLSNNTVAVSITMHILYFVGHEN